MADVVAFARQGACPQAPPAPPATITIPLSDPKRLPSLLYHLAVATELARRVVISGGDDGLVIDGVRSLFDAFNGLASVG